MNLDPNELIKVWRPEFTSRDQKLVAGWQRKILTFDHLSISEDIPVNTSRNEFTICSFAHGVPSELPITDVGWDPEAAQGTAMAQTAFCHMAWARVGNMRITHPKSYQGSSIIHFVALTDCNLLLTPLDAVDQPLSAPLQRSYFAKTRTLFHLQRPALGLQLETDFGPRLMHWGVSRIESNPW